MRLFVATEIPGPHKLSIEKAIQKLRLALPDVRWVAREQWHCTLKFLGEVAEDEVAEASGIIASAAERSRAMSSKLTELGAFSSPRRARVIWVGIEDSENELAYLSMRLEKKLGKAGFRQEARKFRPHITMGRLREARSIEEELEASGPHRLERSPFEISEVVLFRSHLSPKGATYEVVNRYPMSLGPA